MITATVIADSINEEGNRITTMEITLPKVLLAEFNTHRRFSRNFSSSRAIPTKRFVKQDYFYPAYYGANKGGMQAGEELPFVKRLLARILWSLAIRSSTAFSYLLTKVGLHKQWANRTSDWCVMAKGVVTSTEWNNFFKLRDHEAAQPEMRILAQAMKAAMDASVPTLKKQGEWHLPYVTESTGNLEDDLILSASCCAQVSYRTLDMSMDKARKIYSRLIEDDPPHESPIEHQAMAWTVQYSNNFTGGWVQYRQHRNAK